MKDSLRTVSPNGKGRRAWGSQGMSLGSSFILPLLGQLDFLRIYERVSVRTMDSSLWR